VSAGGPPDAFGPLAGWGCFSARPALLSESPAGCPV